MFTARYGLCLYIYIYFYVLPTQCIYVFCVDLRTNIIILSVFKTEAESVYCAARNGSLNKTDTVSSLKGLIFFTEGIPLCLY